MKRIPLSIMLVLTVVFDIVVAPAPAEAAHSEQVNINILPGRLRNTIKASESRSVPLVIFGSEEVDVTTIPLKSVSLTGIPVSKGAQLFCRIEDFGSFDLRFPDNLGSRDGYKDLVCKFSTTEISLILGIIQKVWLTGYFHDEFGNRTPFVGLELVNEPTVLEDKVLCCIVCEGSNCGGCTQHSSGKCDGYLAQCSTRTDKGNSWTGCKPPKVS